MNKSIIFFDYDGVLVNTFHDALEIAQELDHSLTKEEFRKWFRTNPIKSIISAEGDCERFIKKYKEKIKNKDINPKLRNCIKSLYKKYILTIISSSSTHSIKQQLKKEKLRSYFYEIKGYDYHPHKSQKIKNTLKVYNVRPKSSLLITDTLGDIREAHSVNVDVIAVTWGFQDKDTLKEGNPYDIIDHPKNLKLTIKNYYNH